MNAATLTLQWASEDGTHGTPRVSDLQAAGWRRGPAHPFFVGTWLMELSAAESPVAVVDRPAESLPGVPEEILRALDAEPRSGRELGRRLGRRWSDVSWRRSARFRRAGGAGLE